MHAVKTIRSDENYKAIGGLQEGFYIYDHKKKTF